MDDISRKEWESLVSTVTEIKTTLIGMGDTEGLCQKVDKICHAHYKLADNFKLLMGILIGSGILTGGTVGVIKLIG